MLSKRDGRVHNIAALQVSRRQALAAFSVAAAHGCLPTASPSLAAAPPKRPEFCAFVKFIQALPYEELAEKLAAMGYHGVEATVRKNGIVEPERVEEDLPRLVEALRKQNMQVTVMASDINNPSDPVSRKVMETASQLGIRRYRMKYFRYAKDQPIRPQLNEFRRRCAPLAEANRKYGMQALYQNHAGAHYVGATLWDLSYILQDIPPAEIGIAFDIRHATATGGDSWPVLWGVAKPHVQMVYVKDFHWVATDSGKQKMENVPLGEGQVDPKFFKLLGDFLHPISVHVEYLHHGGLQKNLDALAKDLGTLKDWLS